MVFVLLFVNITFKSLAHARQITALYSVSLIVRWEMGVSSKNYCPTLWTTTLIWR